MIRRVLAFSLIFVSFSCRKDEYPEYSTATSYLFKTPPILSELLPPMVIPNNNPMTKEGVELGRQLFYDTKLSADNTQSCASCHAPNNGFTDNEQFSTGIDNIEGNRNSMPLVNLAWMPKLFWDGRANSLESQAFGPVVNPIEMHNTWPDAVASLQNDLLYPGLFKVAFGTELIDSILVSKALSQFERTLLSGNSPFDKYLRNQPTGMTEQEEFEMYQGFALFMDETKGDCFHCHGSDANPLWTDNIFHNNGLDT